MSEVVNGFDDWSNGNDMCLFFEQGNDRSIRCGCNKYISVDDTRDGRTVEFAGNVGFEVNNIYLTY